MTERRGRTTPVVAAGAVVAVAAADVVRRRWQARGREVSPAATAGLFMDSDLDNHEDPDADDTVETRTPAVPRHRAEMSQATEPPAQDPVAGPAPMGEETADLGAPEPEPSPSDLSEEDGEPKAPNWWHRDHPTFSALTGFFTGIAFLIVVPGAYAGILAQMVEYDRAEELFPFILLALVVPIVLMAVPKTRRFGLYMLIGMLSTLVVVGGVAATVLYVLFATN